MLASPSSSAFAAWMTGWFNLLGQVAVTTGIDYGCANLISSTAQASHPLAYVSTPSKTLAIYAALLISHGVFNTFGVGFLNWFNRSSIGFHSIGVAGLMIGLVSKAQSHQSAGFVFEKFYDGTGGWAQRASPAYVAICGILCELRSPRLRISIKRSRREFNSRFSISYLASVAQ